MIRRQPLRRIGAALLGTSLLLGACGSGTETVDTATAPQAETQVDDASTASTFPQFEATTVSGSQLDFGSLEGQDTVVWFWAPW